MNTTRKERFIQKATRLTVKVLLFSLLLSLFLYAGVGTDNALIPDDMLDASIEPGIAQASGNVASSIYAIDSFADYPDVTSFKIDEVYTDYYTKRGRRWTTSTDHTNLGTWDSNTWTIGNHDRHSLTDYASVWFDFDFGEDWQKYSESLTVTVTGSVSNTSPIGGYIFALMSSSTGLSAPGDNYFDPLRDDENIACTGGATTGGEKTFCKNCGSNKFTGNFKISHVIEGRYVRIALATWSGDGRYGTVIASNIDIKVDRVQKGYTINYDKNASDATGSVSATSHKFMAASNVASSTFSRPGYYQSGWNTASNGTGTQLSLGASTGTDATTGLGLAVKNALAKNTTEITLYATWSPVECTINLNTDGGTCSPTSIKKIYGQNIELPNCTKNGYVFLGWTIDGQTYQPGETSQNKFGNFDLSKAENHDKSVTLTASWRPVASTLKFAAGGGSGTIADMPISYGTDFSLPSEGFTWEGHVLTGWTVDGKNYALGQNITNDIIGNSNLGTATSDVPAITLTATWKLVSATLTFNSNGGSGTIGNKTITYGSAFDLPSSGFTRQDYVFVGWSNSSGSDNAANYAPGQQISNNKLGSFDLSNPQNDGETVTLYAVWKSGDFGSKAGGTGLWGSVTNPFVIENSTHLANLSEIVNGVRDPVNSVGGTYYGQSVPETQAKVDSEGRITYVDCYFEIIPETAGTTFTITYTTNGLRPIGSSTETPFRGNFNGNSKTITVNASLPDVDYVGLFGYMDAGSLTNVTVTSGTGAGNGILGRNYVGGVAGWITGVTLSGTIQSTAYVKGGVCAGGLFGVWTLTSDCSATLKYSSAGGTTPWSDGNNVDGTLGVGGITGLIQGGGKTITSSISISGDIDSSTKGAFVGGIAGAAENVTIYPTSVQTISPAVFARGPQTYDNVTGGVVGGFVGYLKNSTLNNLAYSGGNVISATDNGSTPYCGGAVGYATGSIISSVTVTTKVGNNGVRAFANDYTGGIVGYMTNGTISNCTYTAPNSTWGVNGSAYTGGIVGHITGESTITNVTVGANTPVAGTTCVGGYIGYYASTKDLTIVDRTRTGATTGRGDHVGGFIGNIYSTSTKVFKNLTNSGTVQGSSGVGGIIGYNYHDQYGKYSFLITCVNTGAITGTNNVGGIGGYSRDASYYGCVNGDSSNINNVSITGSDDKVGGIAGSISGGTITSSSTSGDYAGSVARNSANYMKIVSSGQGKSQIGGIVGCASWGNVNNSDNYGNVTTTNGSKVGGVVGYYPQGKSTGSNNEVTYHRYEPTNCSNYGDVSGASYVGGIVGHAQTKLINHCVNRGDISGTNYVGGIVGKDEFGTVEYCFNLFGGVTASGENPAVGGIFGEGNSNDNFIKASFAFYTSTALPGDFTVGVPSEDCVYPLKANEDIVDWTQADGFKIVCTVGENKYLKVVLKDDTNTAYSPAGATYSASGATKTLKYNFAGGNANGAESFVVSEVAIADSEMTRSYTYAGTSFTAVIKDNVLPGGSPKYEQSPSLTAIDAGTYDCTITIKLNGAVMGTISTDFTINKKAVSITVDIDVFENQRPAYYVSANDATYCTDSGLVSQHTLSSCTLSQPYDLGDLDSFPKNFDVSISSIVIKDGSGQDVTKNYEISSSGNLTVNAGDFGRMWSGTGIDTSEEWGSEENPYFIKNARHLENLSNIVNGSSNPINSVRGYGGMTASDVQAADRTYSGCYFVVSANITASNTFNPIGTGASNAFKGNFDGRYNGSQKTITLNISKADTNYVGLFGYVQSGADGVIKNVTVAGSVVGGNYTGGIVGYMKSGSLEDSVAKCSVEGKDYVGGIFGAIELNTSVTTQTDLTTEGSVVGINYVGGIVGYIKAVAGKDNKLNWDGAVDVKTVLSWTIAVGAGGSYIGGAIGYVDKGVTIQGSIAFYNGNVDSYALPKDANGASQTMKDDNNGIVGGIIGYNAGSIEATTTFSGSRVLARGTATIKDVEGAYVGGIVGYNASTGYIQNATKAGTNDVSMVSDAADVGNQLYVGGIVGYNAGEVYNCSYTANSAINGINFREGSATSKSNYVGGIAGYSTGKITDCVVDATSPVIISGTSYVGGVVGCVSGSGSVTDCTADCNVSGSLYVGGLAGHVTGTGSISDCTSSGEVSGASNVGGYVGYYNSSAALTFENLSRSDSTTATGDNVGGFFGQINTEGTVTLKNLTNSANITGTNYVGGIVGMQHYGNVENCTNNGAVSAVGDVGGISGSANNSSKISNSTNNGAITGSSHYVGGILGSAYNDGSIVVITNATNSGAVYTNGNYVGGILGGTQPDATATLSGTLTNTGSVRGVSYVGGIVGRLCNATDAELTLTWTATVSIATAVINSGTVGVAAIGDYLGGVIGWLGARIKITEDSTIRFTSKDVDMDWSQNTNGGAIGGIVGYNEGTILATTSFTGGRILDRAGSDTNVTIDEVAGAYVGGIVGYNAGTIKNATKGGSDDISSMGSNPYVGGIAGYNSGTIESCNYIANSTVNGINMRETTYLYSADYVGGIAGYNAGNINHCYADSANLIVYGDEYVGGIAGYNAGTIKYTYFNGIVKGASNVGGIVGYNTSANVQYNYVQNGANVKKTTNFGGVVGASTKVIKNSWAFYKDTSFIENKDSIGRAETGYCVVNMVGATILPSDFVGESNIKQFTSWDIIVSKNIDGFYFASGIEVEQENYLSLEKWSVSDENDSAEWSVTGYARPVRISTEHAPSGCTNKVIFEEIFLHYSESEATNILARFLPIKYSTADMIYDGTDKRDNLSMVFSGEGYDVDVNGYNNVYSITAVDVEGNDAVNVTEEGFTFTAHVYAKGVIMGCKRGSKAQISPFDITGTESRIFYDGEVFGAPTFDTYTTTIKGVEKTLTDVTDFRYNKGIIQYEPGRTFYIYRQVKNSDGDVERMLLLYYVTLNYGETGMAGDHYTETGVALNGAISTSHGGVSLSNGHLVDRMQDGTTTFTSVADKNYIGTVNLTYYTIDSDFGVKDGADTGAAWGSEQNPYVISHWIHLFRLSEIVNGFSNPINSVRGYGIYANNAQSNEVVSASTSYVAHNNDGTIKKSYFLVTENIDMSALPPQFHFYPIGGWAIESTTDNNGLTKNVVVDNGSTFFGGVFDGQAATGYSATINVGNHLTRAGQNYIGLFGAVRGTEINGTIASAEINNITVASTGNSLVGGNYVGTLIGRADMYARVDYTYYNREGAAVTNQFVNEMTVKGTNYVGGIVGYIGLGCEMYGDFVNNATVTGSGNYIGGIIGQLMAGAGRKGTTVDTYEFGEYTAEGNTYKLIMSNTANISGGITSDYVGGLVGGMVTNDIVVTDNDGNVVVDYTGVSSVVAPTQFRNTGRVSGRYYIGGFVGATKENVALHITNDQVPADTVGGTVTEANANNNTWSYNGDIDSASGQITGLGYVGGLFGELGAAGHQIQGVFSTAVVGTTASSTSSDGTHIGGLIGIMNGGTLTQCFVTTPKDTAINIESNLITGNVNVGGLVGYMAIGKLDSCYMQGFKFDNNVSAVKGGVAGVATSIANIGNTWALYLTSDPTYSSVPANTYGKYILSFFSGSDGAKPATIEEIFVFAGLLKSTTTINATNGTVSATSGKVSLGITLPEVDKKIDNFDTKAQVVFYDGSGYETAYGQAFDLAGNSGNDLYIRFNSANESIIIAKAGIRFGSITDYGSADSWESKYVYLGGDEISGLYKIEVTGPPEQTEQTSCDSDSAHSTNPKKVEPNFVGCYQTQYSYDRSGTGNYILTSRHLSFEYEMYSAVAPRIIDSLDDWKAFALDVQTSGTGGLDQYVKLAADITVPTKYKSNGEAGTISGKVYSGIAGFENTDAADAHYFSGIFDGDGHTITIDIVGGSLGATPSADGTYYEVLRDSDRALINATITGANGTTTNVASSSNELGLFPQAHNATFQNVTLDGTITSTGSDIGAFVGIARGDLTFYNCTNKADVKSTGTSSHNVGGIVGTANNQNVTFIGCVNQGDITGEWNYREGSGGGFLGVGKTYYLIVDRGTGGILGSTGTGTGSTILIDSCRNAGTITGDSAVGGIVGACRAAAQITNCGNTGYCHATNIQNGDTKHGSDCAVGGIVGAASEEGGANIYACYNSGKIVADGNKAGGIIGSDAEFDVSLRLTKIYNCYNVGDIYTGGEDPHTSNTGYGVQAGGIIGTSIRAEIYYCYNVGKVTSNGIVYHLTNPHSRVGGIAGHASAENAVTQDGVTRSASTTIYGCYNAGPIILGVNYDTYGAAGYDKDNNWHLFAERNQTTYAAGIIGHISTSDRYALNDLNSTKQIKVVNSFSLNYQVERLHPGAHALPASTPGTLTGLHANRFQGAAANQESCASSGDYLSSLEELTCVYDSATGVVRPKNDKVYEVFGGSGVSTALTSSYQDGTINASQLAQGLTSGGYVFVYGCLPQLAVFALDTENGTAMTSQNYVKDKMGVYNLEKAGSENNPYVIKDGIDLMGVNALMQTGYNFDNKYIEFANGENNLLGDICESINMPNETAGEGIDAADKQNYYKFYDGSDYSEGKSYHLFKNGAYCSLQTVGNFVERVEYTNGYDVPVEKTIYARTGWKNANDYWNGNSWVADGDLTNVNYYGKYGTAFKGTIDGHNGSGPSVISNAKIVYSASNLSIGLFGLIEDATVKNIAVTGTIDAYGSGTVSAGVVGKALGNSRIVGVHAGSATVTTGSSNGKLSVTTHSGNKGYVGGIVGMADSGKAGNRLTIEESVVAKAVLYSHVDTVGGIVGYTRGDNAASFIDIVGCHVQEAKLTAFNNKMIGGIVGRAGSVNKDEDNDSGALSIEKCYVGTKDEKTPISNPYVDNNSNVTGKNAKVLIEGYGGLGGIISFADAGTKTYDGKTYEGTVSFTDCYVYGDVLIKKTSAANYDKTTYFTSIGGITGFVSDGNGYVTFRGNIDFHGTIDVSGHEGVENVVVKNVGGVVGYMGTSARMERSFVEVYGYINADNCGKSENIGGFAGISKGVCLDGVFAIAPRLNTPVSDNVGGFIGLNDGDTYITRTSLIYTSKIVWDLTEDDADGDGFPDKTEIGEGTANTIVADEYVGGFIGANSTNGKLHMGAAMFDGAPYGSDNDEATIILRASVDGQEYIGGFLGYNDGAVYGEYCSVTNNGAVGANSTSIGTVGTPVNYIGGVFGGNTANGLIQVDSNASFVNGGQVGINSITVDSTTYSYDGANGTTCAQQYYVGGVVGDTSGVIVNIGTLANNGSVYGYKYVGGVIGNNDGSVQIARTATITTATTGVVLAQEMVGGFIGSNVTAGSAVGVLNMGIEEYDNTVFGTNDNRATITLGAQVDGKRYIGGFLGYNNGIINGEYCSVTNTGAVGTNSLPDPTYKTIDCIGGVFGDNSEGGVINISSRATFINSGQVGHSDFENAKQEFVGGIIGVALGTITNNGTLGNIGSVYGYQYVGGAIGGLVSGVISGVLTNGQASAEPVNSYAGSEALEASDEATTEALTSSGNSTGKVEAVVNVGGAIGVIMQAGKVSNAVIVNHGEVLSSGDMYNVSNLGGAIGLNYGVIEGSEFYNYGRIAAKNFAGGAIGVNDGTIMGLYEDGALIKESKFINYAAITFTGDTALGGAVGYITNNYTTHGDKEKGEYVSYYPDNEELKKYWYVDNTNYATVTDTYFGYESLNNTTKVELRATGADPYPLKEKLGSNPNTVRSILAQISEEVEEGKEEESAFVAKGGLGGVFGAINSDDMKWDEELQKVVGWSNNTFFIYGDVYGGIVDNNEFTGTVDAVGGVIGAIEVSYISISNMVSYRSNVGGRNYVGGIVGYNDSKNSTAGAGASIDNCYNVYGNVYGDSDVGGIVGYVVGVSGDGMMSSNNTPKTHASYWIFEYSNEMLQNSDPNNLTTTLNRSWETVITDYQYENDIDPNEGENDAYLTEENGLTWKEYFIKKLHPTYTVDSSNNVGYYDDDDQWHTVISSANYEGNIDVNDTLKNFGVSTWKEYFIRKAGYSINAVDDIGTYSGGGVNYNTGTEATGYYYLFANDSDDFAPGRITVDHDHGENTILADPYADNESLNYWLLIAGSAKRAKVDNDTYYDEYPSDFVHENVDDGKVKKGFIYSTGYSADENGYYLYVKDQGNKTTLNSTTTDGVVRVFASSDASSAGNVMIFYRKVAPRNTLVYNGRERYASIIDLNFAEEKPTSLAQGEIAQYFGKYYYTFSDVQSENGSNPGINLGTSAKRHHLKADIWSIDSDGNAIVLGSVDSTADNGSEFMWSIRKRTFDISFESGHIDEDTNNAFRFDGTFSHYIKFTVSNIALAENISNKFEGIKGIVSPEYLFNNSDGEPIIEIYGDDVDVPSKDEMEKIPYKEGVDYIANAAQLTGDMTSSNVNDTQNCYRYNSETSKYEYSSVSQVPIYGITYLVYFMKAGTHRINVEAKDSNHKAPSKNTASITVNKRELKLKVITSEDSWMTNYIFDGGVKWQGVQSVVITNFIPGSINAGTDCSYLITNNSTSGLIDGNGIIKDDSKKKPWSTAADTVTVNFYANDAASYTAELVIHKDWVNSYYFVFEGAKIGTLSEGNEPDKWSVGWTINKKSITLENVRIKEKDDVYYDGKIHSIEFEGGEAGASFEQTWGNEVIYIDCNLSISGQGGNDNLCNADVYTVSLSATDGTNGSGSARVETASGKTSLAKAGEKNYIIKYSSSGDTMEFEIKKRSARLVWAPDKTSFIYSAGPQGLDAKDLKFEMSDDGGNNWDEVTGAKMSISGNQLKVGGIFEGETLIFDIANFKNTNAKTSAYEASVTEFANVTGTNAVDNVTTDNYDMHLPEAQEYTINKATLTLTVTITKIDDKEFDNTTTLDDDYFDYTPSVTSNGAVGGVKISSVTGTFSDKNVGDRTVSFSVSASVQDSTNYKLNPTIVVNGANTASITPAPIVIKLNSGANGDLYKTFDNNNIYAVVYSSSGEVRSTGSQFRTGRGVTVNGFYTKGITLTVTFVEAGEDREWADAYVNNIVRTDTDNGIDNDYVYEAVKEGYYKNLRFVLGENEDEQEQPDFDITTNYYIRDIVGYDLVKKSANVYEVVDNKDTPFTIAIKKASVKAGYDNTSQSYANTNNTYNTSWNPVTGELKVPTSWHLGNNEITLDISNGWRYDENGEAKVYTKYTRIAGSASSERLGAVLTSDNGKHLCLTLRNQPTLIIGYFVYDEDTDAYQIGTMAGLLLATEYFKNNFNTSEEKGYDYVQTEIPFSKEVVTNGHSNTYPKVPASVYTQIANNEITTWEQLLAAVPEYDPRGYTTANGDKYTPMTLYTTIQGNIATTTDSAYKEALQLQLDSFEFVYELIDKSGKIVETDTLHLVWWVPEEVKDTRTYDSFILVDNIDAILTNADMLMLKSAYNDFGTGWGMGTAYLPNVVFAREGSAVIFNGPVFDYALDQDNNKIAFNGLFNGNNYTIDHLTIMYSVQGAGEHNVGMFAEITGEVTGVNLRNLNIQVVDSTNSDQVVINVGGVVGKYTAPIVDSQMVAGMMKDVTVHGAITVKSTAGTVYVGGVIGHDYTKKVGAEAYNVVDGAIVVATLRAEGATAVVGGIVGAMDNDGTIVKLQNVVSLSEVYAKGETEETTYANGYVGMSTTVGGVSSTSLQDGAGYVPVGKYGYLDSVFEILPDGTYDLIEGGSTYTELYTGSNSILINGKYPTRNDSSNVSEAGTYDVISKEDVAGTETRSRESMRLRDIVDTYVLGYEISMVKSGEIDTYQKATTSKYVGEANGTTAKPINIAYQQHVNLIRMFNYMVFNLKRDITTYTGYTLPVVDEAFTGTVNDGGYKIKVHDVSTYVALTPEEKAAYTANSFADTVYMKDSNGLFVKYAAGLDENTTYYKKNPYPVMFANQTEQYPWLTKQQ